MRGARAIGADQHITAVSSGDLGDRLAQDLDVIGGGVRPGVARPQARGQELGRVVAPHADRVVAEGALVRWRSMFFLAVGDHDGGVHIEHDGRSQVPSRTHRCGHPTGQVGPHVPVGAGPRYLDLLALTGSDLIESSPHRRCRRHRPESCRLAAQDADIRDGLAATGEHDRDVDQHPAAVMDRSEPAASHGP